MEKAERYKEFLSQLILEEGVWVLVDNDDWVVLASDDPNYKYSIFLWNKMEKAEKGANNFISGLPEKIEINEFLKEVLPQFINEQIEIGIYVNESQSIFISAKDFRDNLLYEIANKKDEKKTDVNYKGYVEENILTNDKKSNGSLNFYHLLERIDDRYFNNLFYADKNKRYSSFIKIICRDEIIYTIKQGSLFAFISEESDYYLPVWPEKEFAEKSLTGKWENYEIVSFNFSEWCSIILDYLKVTGYSVAVFPNNESYIAVKPEKLRIEMDEELEFYE